MNELDQHFKNSFKDFTVSPSDQVWKNVEQQLPPNRQKSSLRLIISVASMAASVALLFTLGLFEQPQVVPTPHIIPSEDLNLPLPSESMLSTPETQGVVDVDLATQELLTPAPRPKNDRREAAATLTTLDPKTVLFEPTTVASFALVKSPPMHPRVINQLSDQKVPIRLAYDAATDRLSRWMGKQARALGENTTEVVAIGVVNWSQKKHDIQQRLATLTP